MHDTVRIEERGVPAVALVHDRFEAAAKNQIKMLGLASAKVVTITEPQTGEPETELAGHIDRVWDEIVGSLIKSSGN